MAVHCFTSISFSYLNRARVLGASIKQHHPDWVLWLLISDERPDGFPFDFKNEPWDRIVYAREILPIQNIDAWFFRHDIVELCTAVKGPFLQYLLENGADKVLYLDPDIAVLNTLDPLTAMLDQHSVLLTPHQLDPDDDTQSVWDNEICSLAHGTYNLGFLAVRSDVNGNDFARWWSDRCQRFCFDKKEQGLFVDQKWCDLAPALFDGVHVVRDPGYNVASWNLNRREISVGDDGSFFVNKIFLLRFYHFTKLGPIGDAMTRRYGRDNLEVFELWSWYKRKIADATDERIPLGYWYYSQFSSGNKIPKQARELYRHRVDLQVAFPNPFVVGAGSFEEWFQANE